MSEPRGPFGYGMQGVLRDLLREPYRDAPLVYVSHQTYNQLRDAIAESQERLGEDRLNIQPADDAGNPLPGVRAVTLRQPHTNTRRTVGPIEAENQAYLNRMLTEKIREFSARLRTKYNLADPETLAGGTRVTVPFQERLVGAVTFSEEDALRPQGAVYYALTFQVNTWCWGSGDHERLKHWVRVE